MLDISNPGTKRYENTNLNSFVITSYQGSLKNESVSISLAPCQDADIFNYPVSMMI